MALAFLRHDICLHKLRLPTTRFEGSRPPGKHVTSQNISMNFKWDMNGTHRTKYVSLDVGGMCVCSLLVK